MNILTLNDIAYAYEGSKKKVFEHLFCEFEEGKIYAVVGKTTLLSILSGLTNPTEGTVYYRDKDVSKLDRYEYRSKYVGIIFQSFNLLAHLTAQENVMLSMDVSGVHYTDKKEKAMELLHKVGLSEDEAKRRILKLSAMSRKSFLLMNRPAISIRKQKMRSWIFFNNSRRKENALLS